jgi:hypothetical protein
MSVLSGCVLDLDGDGDALATSDGVIALRALLGLSGEALMIGAANGSSASSAAAAVTRVTRMANARILDLDDDGSVTANVDGLLLLRAMLGFRGNTLISNVVTSSSRRADPAQIINYLGSNCLSGVGG